MNNNHHLIAYLATLLALCLIFVAALVAASTGKLSSVESLGLGTITGGLIGILRLPSQRNVHVDNPPTDPVQVEQNP